MNHLYSQGDKILQHVASRVFHLPLDKIYIFVKSHGTYLSFPQNLTYSTKPIPHTYTQSTWTHKFIFLLRLTLAFSFGIRATHYNVLWNGRDAYRKRMSDEMMAGQSASNDLFVHAVKMIRTLLLAGIHKDHNFSLTTISQTMENPVEQSKNNPWYLIFVLFFDKQQ